MVGLVLALAACTTGPAQDEVAQALVDEGLVPPLEQAVVELDELATSVAAFCDDPGAASQAAAQERWSAAKEAWEAVEFLTYFEPESMLSTLAKVDYSPISEEGIRELLSSSTIIDYEYVDNRAASTRRGLGAVEFGLFSPLELAAEDRMCAMLVAASAVAADSVTEMRSVWVTAGVDGEAPYRDVLTMSMQPRETFGETVGAYVETLKRQSLFELGQVLGLSAPEPDPEALPEGPAGAGIVAYGSQIAAIKLSFDAGGDSSLSNLVRSRSRSVADQIDSLLGEAEALLSSLDGSMGTAVVEDPETMTHLYDLLRELQVLFEADVVSILDITLGFSDADGDSG